MFDPQRLLGQLLGDALGGDFGHRRKRGSGLSFGTKAQLGLGALGVAMAAYEHFSQQKPTEPATTAGAMPPPAPAYAAAIAAAVPPGPPPPAPAATIDPALLPQEQADAVLLVQSMIAAAAADGVIDPTERQRVLDRACAAGVDAETRSFLEAELAVPKSADRIGALTRPGLTREVYAAAAVAIDIDSEAERRFLQTLGNALGLDEDARIAIHEQIEGRVV
ncbi:MAG: DUF533 domain-containing protein [Xanthomonadales bacterium]|nr:DUF533 domain-containing protein [Xanthomonadales bacterium]MBK7145088.1 DUF533 domain-containing protein [Xanthomonadales bacterium]MCC6560239.1 DUF533 domain-containing protein [Xanthomonadales bacterium]